MAGTIPERPLQIKGAMSNDTRGQIERLLAIRQMTHGELAKRANIHPGELSKMINQRRPFGVAHLVNIARVLEVMPGELLDAGRANPEVRRRDQLDSWIEAETTRLADSIRNQVRFVMGLELAAEAQRILAAGEAEEPRQRKERAK